MSAMSRHRLAVALIVTAIAIASVTLIQVWDATRGGGGTASNAAALPTACENFAEASALFAHGGSAETLRMTGGGVFTRDPEMDAKQILDALMESCDAEWSSRTP